MTMLEQRIRQQFYDASDVMVLQAEALARPLAEAVDVAVSALTAGGRLLFAGTGWAQAEALHAAAMVCAGAERPRPGLPAFALGGDAAALSTLVQCEGSPSAALARQIQALSLPGDVLVLFEGRTAEVEAEAARSLETWVRAAHDREMSVLLWSSAHREAPDPVAATLLTDTDVHIPIRADRLAHRSALLRLGWMFVAEAIDMQLLGEQD